ncbi:MAG: tetratricopeptide repeat protein [Chitinophagaceae bacterium]
MKKYLGVFLAAFVLVAAGCDKKAKEIAEIEEMAVAVDSIIKINPVLNVGQKVEAEKLINEYLEFANNYPEDSLSAEYLMKTAILYHLMPDYGKELAILEKVIAQYPNSAYAPQALAIGARVSEDNLKNYEQAKTYLKQIQDKYSDSPYAVNIDLQIEHVGDLEGLLEAIMERTGVTLDEAFSKADSIDAVK